jgi:acid phosphatase family membrane protein YuiD
MRFFTELFQNKTLFCVSTAWFVAQAIKILIQGIRDKDWSFRYFFNSGGMPSSHSASVAALAVMVGYCEGYDSPVFAASVLLMFIVMYDAAGVRRETGRQGKALNSLADFFKLEDELIPAKGLKEQVGHSPLQVIAGGLLGVLCAVLFIIF